VDADVAGQDFQHRDGARGLLAVGLPLRAQPCVTNSGFASAISRASWTIFAAGMPVIGAAHSGVFAVLSAPVPRM